MKDFCSESYEVGPNGVGQLGPAKATRTRQLGQIKCRTKTTRIYLFRTEKRHILRAFNQEYDIGFGNYPGSLSYFVAYTRKLGNRRSSECIRSFKPSNRTHLLVLTILAGDIEMNPGPRSLSFFFFLYILPHALADILGRLAQRLLVSDRKS